MRHSSIDLTMNAYTDPRLLDVQGAIESLPSISVTSDPTESRQRIAVGAENFAHCSVAVPVAVPPDFSGNSQSTPVTMLAISSEPTFANTLDASSDRATKNAHCSMKTTSVSKGGQADLNRRPPDPQSGAAGFQPTKTKRVARRRSAGCTTGCTNSPENERGEVVGGSVSSRADALPIKADSFSAALAMIASLPLSDAEKAAAVRRLMAEHFQNRGEN